MPSLLFRDASPADAHALLLLLREAPLPGPVSIAIEASSHPPPPFLVPESSRTVVACSSCPNEPVACAARLVHRVWLHGQPALTGYLTQLRRLPGVLVTRRRLAAGFASLQHDPLPGESPFDFTSIIESNLPARRLLERGLPGLPTYHPAGRLATLTFSAVRAARAASPNAAALLPQDHDEALDFLHHHLRHRQLAPWFDRSALSLPSLHWFILKESGQITGAVALWDQQTFKRIIVHSYAPLLRRLRPFLNPFRLLAGSFTLPPHGQELPLAFLAFLATAGDDPARILLLIASASRAALHLHFPVLSLGLPADHPTLPTLRQRWRAHSISSTIYLVTPPGSHPPQPLPSPVHPEIALL